MALIPCSKSAPAWEGRPCAVTVNPPEPLRAIFNFPSAPSPHSRTNARSAPRASMRIKRLESGLPISSSVFTNTMGVTDGSKSEFAQCTQREDDLDESALHVGDALDRRAAHPPRGGGISASVPVGQTVSMCPSKSCHESPRRRWAGRA